jgi:hyperosmotically inducible protein
VQKVGPDTDSAALDHQITTDVESAFLLDSITRDSNIAVTTTHGVVALTGNLPDQSAVDHVTEAVGRIKDVKSVDNSALIVTQL